MELTKDMALTVMQSVLPVEPEAVERQEARFPTYVAQCGALELICREDFIDGCRHIKLMISPRYNMLAGDMIFCFNPDTLARDTYMETAWCRSRMEDAARFWLHRMGQEAAHKFVDECE